MNKDDLIKNTTKVAASLVGYLACGFHCTSKLLQKGSNKLSVLAGADPKSCLCCCKPKDGKCSGENCSNAACDCKKSNCQDGKCKGKNCTDKNCECRKGEDKDKQSSDEKLK
ncbi:MAG: hypothetical protein JWM09_63 [Francisellaceae bacterium]|nr:hypothetical protein [Francisellaceae bacterium]